MNYWLVKSEPESYSWQLFVKEGRAVWDGVRNYEARNNLSKMKTGDKVLYYHSNKGKEIVGIAQVIRESYPDPTTTDSRWVAVDLIPVEELKKSITFEQIKTNSVLKNILLVKQTRLSVMPLKKEEFEIICELGK